MAIKLTDVAKKAGVSSTTVSRVINNYGSLSQKTINKVHVAMEELNYQPNSLARSLQGKNTQLIGLIFPKIAHPFFGELVEQLETKLFERGYKSILCDSSQNKEKERNYLKMLAANQVDGIVAGSHNLGIEEYEMVELPIISFDRYLADNISIVGSDNYQGGYIATETLYKNGGRKIGIIAGSNVSDSPTNDRLNGHLAFLKEVGLEPNIFYFAPFENSLALKKMKIKQILLNQNIDSLFCTDDLTATLVINICRELNIDIPSQLKVIGYDGTQFMQNYFPDLATIVQPIQEASDLLVDLLIQRITQPEIPLEKTYKLPIKVLTGRTV
ncbi:LacI family transcriptional regulator [Tetragenococcus osmophilus]|uniref:LacI family transcriptional regulator n=1 Tax=Tetragenococcus osmophilus TaxID=526944 RepID=A0AA38CYS4_9ENTE|nr:LacI family DNA-binding transcriptional regulator [Tetragenococcus osmophilus]AYW48396.1 LacI family transcriptional regulator [Tetragenococcus osmophilus]GMA71892.1 LacI family transcriptional regulator [Tetragenococcus osmophilus]